MTSRKIPESAVENLVSDLEGKANVANTVTTNTSQTITGQKAFTTQLLRKSTDIDVTSKATSDTYNPAVRFFDKNGKDIGALNNVQKNEGNIRTQLEARNKDNYVTSIGVQAPYEGSTGGFGYAPNTPDNAPANAIVTKNKIANMVTTNTTQTISGSKRFTQPSAGMSIELTADTNQQTVPTTPTGRQLGLYLNATYSKGDGYTSWLQGTRGSDGWTGTEIYTRRFLESDSQEIINYLRVNISPEGIPVAYTRTPPVGVAGEEIVTAGWVRNACLIPGEIIIWSAPTPPAGYLVCNGAAISRTTYADLFKVIGTTWGAGDGNTTFNVPNFADRYPVGSGSLGAIGTLLGQGLPNITGSCTAYELGVYGGDTQNGALGITQSAQRGSNGHGSQAININLDASKSNGIYGASDRVQPFSSVVCFCIRY